MSRRNVLNMSVNTTSSAQLRDALVNRLMTDHEAKGLRMLPEVERALRTVPRHLLHPGRMPGGGV